MSDDERKLPTSRFGRLARMAQVGARSGANLLLGGDSSSAAQKASAMLGSMRGVATKVGQMASYVDGVLPEQHREAYETWMTRLQSSAPKSSPAAIRAVVEAELKAPIDQLFAEWSTEPFASASIGQVHRAVLHDGRVVAVKVQHPGIREAMESDLKNAGFLESTVGVVAGLRRFESKRVLEEVRMRFREELDYRLEAQRQVAFAELFRNDPQIVVPQVISDHCSGIVLTTELASGLNLEQARQAPEGDRVAWCETLWHFVYKASLVGGLFNADPHPGNYFFQPDGRVVFIDFGCVQPVEGPKRVYARALHETAHRMDDAGFEAACVGMLDLVGGAYQKRAVAYVKKCFLPVWGAPWRMTRAYVSELVADMKQLALDFRKGKDDGYVALPPNMFFLNRLQFGFYSVLARLDAEVDYVAVERAFLAAG